jgi:hypothetical protein
MIGSQRKHNDGKLAMRWNEIFWEEMILNYPSVFDDQSMKQSIKKSSSLNPDAEIVVLPDIDDDDLLFLSKKREALSQSESSFNVDESERVIINIQALEKDKDNNKTLENKKDANKEITTTENDAYDDEINPDKIEAHAV